MNPEVYLRQMRDIEGLDAIGYWPLAPAWWLLLIALILVLMLVLHLWPRLVGGQPRAPWRRDAARQLRQLNQRLGQTSDRHLAAELSELLRRIAVARCGRDSCAGLQGRAWLEWLSRNDPKGFDWASQGRALIELPFAPPEQAAQADLAPLLRATRAWVRAAEHCPRSGGQAT
jgi:hypothetical protein